MKDERLVIVRPAPADDRPRWAFVGASAAVALSAGLLWPRACGMRSESEPEVAAAGASAEAPVNEPPRLSSSAGPAIVAPAVTAEAPSGVGSIVVGRSTLLQCQDPPAAELKPSKCGEHGLDPAVVPKLEQLGSCPAIVGVTGKLALTLDLDFSKAAAKATAGRGSSVVRGGRRDDKAIEPILQCVRSAMKDLVSATESAPREHQRYVLSYPLTIAAPAAPAAPVVVSEKAASGVATIQVDTAIVRDAPSTSGQPIGRLSRGTKVATIGISGNWFHVRFGEGDRQEGWIFRTNIGR